MPLNDDYKTERELKEFSNETAKAITEALVEMGKNKSWGFMLFFVDFNTATLNYISDMQKSDAITALKAYIAREVQ